MYSLFTGSYEIQKIILSIWIMRFFKFKLPGMALNEAAVQLMSSKALNVKMDIVKYYDIKFTYK